MQNLIYCHMWQRGEGALTIGTASRQHNHSQSQSPLYAFAKTVPVNVLTQCQRCLTVAHLLVGLMQCVSHHHIKQNVVQMFHAAISEKNNQRAKDTTKDADIQFHSNQFRLGLCCISRV